MIWKRWLTYDPYKKLWFWVGRPFTFILRDVWHKAEFVWIIGLVSLGVWMGHNFDWLIVLKIMSIFTVGFIFGHLFWAKDYIPDQQLPDEDIIAFPEED